MTTDLACIVELLKSRKPVVLARIIRQSGSAPRSIGTSCLVLEDGSIKGTIGGGALEYEVIRKAREVFASQVPVLLEFRLTGTDVAETEMLCGGLVDVYLEPLDPDNKGALDVFQQALQLMEDGGEGVLISRIMEAAGAGETQRHALLRSDGRSVGGLLEAIVTAGFPVKELLGRKQAQIWETGEDPDSLRFFSEPLKPDSVLYLFGAGHVSTFVAPLAAMAGFRVVVVDDREEFANPERFPQADSILVCPIREAYQNIRVNSASFIAIITRGHLHDREALEAALGKQPVYIGMIGSLRKRNMIYRSLLESGFSAEDLARVHSPIGLDIGAETPEEIAVSIVAELIQVRALAPGEKAPSESGTDL